MEPLGEKHVQQPARPRAGLHPGQAGSAPGEQIDQRTVEAEQRAGQPACRQPWAGPRSSRPGSQQKLPAKARPRPSQGEKQAGWPPEASGPAPAGQPGPFFFIFFYLKTVS